jgi:hypothetical protein
MGATACIIVNSFIDYYEKTADWTALAWWIHDRIDYYNAITFFPKYAAFNIGWSENPECRKLYIYSYIPNPYTGKKGYLTRLGAENYSGSHKQFYEELATQLAMTL